MTSKGPANILVFNPGSSSVKYRLIRMPGEVDLLTGEAERVGIKTQEGSFINHFVHGKKRVIKADMPDHASAFSAIMEVIKKDVSEDESIFVSAFAHRFVHPGDLYDKTLKVGQSDLKRLRATFDLAPIHNPVSHSFMEACAKLSPDIPQYAVFDTAFHAAMPPENKTYAIPGALARKYGIKRVGFHGISHSFVTAEACRFLGRDIETQKIISCHLGTGGASVAAVKYGRSINNSMGLTPLEGLVMNTRSGDIDVSAVFTIITGERFTPKQADEMLNKKSGVLGVFGNSSDLRDALKTFSTDSNAAEAINLFIKRIRKYIGYYSLLLGKADILLFTDSLGVLVPYIRERVCENMDAFGIAIDGEANASFKGGNADITSFGGGVKVLVIPTNEEIMIAREAYGAFK